MVLKYALQFQAAIRNDSHTSIVKVSNQERSDLNKDWNGSFWWMI